MCSSLIAEPVTTLVQSFGAWRNLWTPDSYHTQPRRCTTRLARYEILYYVFPHPTKNNRTGTRYSWTVVIEKFQSYAANKERGSYSVIWRVSLFNLFVHTFLYPTSSSHTQRAKGLWMWSSKVWWATYFTVCSLFIHAFKNITKLLYIFSRIQTHGAVSIVISSYIWCGLEFYGAVWSGLKWSSEVVSWGLKWFSEVGSGLLRYEVVLCGLKGSGYVWNGLV